MNKFLTVFVLFAAAVCCSALDVNEADAEKEVGLLLGNQKLFSPFCLEQHAKITSNIKERAAKESSAVFAIFFGAATEIADEILTVEKQAVEELAQQIAEPYGEVKNGPLTENQIESLIAKGRLEIQSKTNVFGRVFAAAKSALGSVLYNAANSAIFVRLAHLRSKMTGDNLLDGIVQTCKQVSEYETDLEGHFNQTKVQLKAENTETEAQEFINKVTLPSLNCFTTKFVTRLNAFCNLFTTGASPFFKMLGLNPDLKFPQ